MAVAPEDADALGAAADLAEAAEGHEAAVVALGEHDAVGADPPRQRRRALPQTPRHVHEDEQLRVAAHAAHDLPGPLLSSRLRRRRHPRAEVHVGAAHGPQPPGRHDGVPEREVRPVDDDVGDVARFEREQRVDALGRQRDAVALVGADQPGGRVRGLLGRQGGCRGRQLRRRHRRRRRRGITRVCPRLQRESLLRALRYRRLDVFHRRVQGFDARPLEL